MQELSVSNSNLHQNNNTLKEQLAGLQKELQTTQQPSLKKGELFNTEDDFERDLDSPLEDEAFNAQDEKYTRKFLLNELLHLKGQMYMKLNSFKTKIEGSSLNTTLTPGKKF